MCSRYDHSDTWVFLTHGKQRKKTEQNAHKHGIFVPLARRHHAESVSSAEKSKQTRQGGFEYTKKDKERKKERRMFPYTNTSYSVFNYGEKQT